LLATATFATAQESQNQKLDRQFQAAVADYDAGRFAQAATQLEQLLPYASKSFEVHELLGLVYASQSQDDQAIKELEFATRLRPDSAAARTNLAASLIHAGKSALALGQLQKALALDPKDFEANHDIGEYYIQAGKIPRATPYLEQAQQINPASYDNGYDLAQTYYVTGNLPQATELAQNLLKQKNTGELHNLLGHIEEKDGKFVAAANEYETAAHMDPNEENLFDWGSEYLLHRTFEPAIDIFEQGTQRYPNSPRLLIGLGMAMYSRGKYEEAVKALLAAAALDPSDARCYLFLSKAFDSSPNHTDEVIQAFRRFSELQPNNAQAHYYYAMSLWKGKRSEETGPDFGRIESILHRAVALDPTFADPHVELGNLYADQREYAKSIPEYERALELNPNLPDAHYRLGQGYVHVGQKDRAQTEFAVYQQQRAEHMAEVDKERAEVQQFVYSAKSTPATKP